MGKRRISRRQFLEGTGTVLTVAAAAPALRAQPPAAPPSSPRTKITLTLNGASKTIDVDDRWTLAEALRDHLGLTGTKIGCHRAAESLALTQPFSSADSPVKALKPVGHDTPRIDAALRVSGKATYTGDVMLPGMLYARVLRSPHPHARIKSIDTSKAKALAGVKAIVTHENCQVVWGAGSISGGAQYNDETKKITKHRRYAFNNPVRFVGDPVAAVAAIDRHTAEEALQLITVEYEPLPFVLDPEDALKPGAVQIWP